jgi:hypothetical protein
MQFIKVAKNYQEKGMLRVFGWVWMKMTQAGEE